MSALGKIITYSSFLVITFLILFLIKAFNVSYPLDITITNTTKSTELAVVGEGKVEAIPDTIYVTAGIVVNKASTAENAQADMDKVNNNIIEAMKILGIDKADVKTSGYNIYPSYNYRQEGGNTIDGYNGSASVEIKITDAKLATKVINEATKAGANQISGTRFVIDKPEKYREQARDMAISNAKDQAQKLAQNLGISLGKVTNMVESSPGNINYERYASMDLALPKSGGGGGPTLEAGTQTVTSTVTLYFEKK
jgi:uncharacterized protein YggE